MVLSSQRLIIDDDQFGGDLTISGWRDRVNTLLDTFLDLDWLTWAQPIGLMPATQAKARRLTEEAARRRSVDEEAQQLAQQQRLAEEEARKQQEAAVVQRPLGSTGGSGKASGAAWPVRAAARKAPQVIVVDDDMEMASDAGSSGTVRRLMTKQDEVSLAWSAVKAGRAPLGYVEVRSSPISSLAY
jgi:hypothetical protein